VCTPELTFMTPQLRFLLNLIAKKKTKSSERGATQPKKKTRLSPLLFIVLFGYS
jgi:hypothetical protein